MATSALARCMRYAHMRAQDIYVACLAGEGPSSALSGALQGSVFISLAGTMARIRRTLRDNSQGTTTL
eukprot:6487772-Alexandrium_andersonii.AAC.1